MTNWSTNRTIFVGPKTALDDIARTITPTGEFDFNLLYPTPAVFGVMSSPCYATSDAEFAAKHDLDRAPQTIDELIALANEDDYPYGLREVPATVHAVIVDTYGDSDWFDWRTRNWDTKWTGRNADAERFHDNLLIVTYDTAWAPPAGIFSHLRANYENLHIINGADIEGFSEGIDVSDGGLTSFHAYFTTYSSIQIEPYDFSHLPGFTDASDGAKQSVDLWYTEQCEINTANIDTLIEHGVLVGEEGEIVRIADIKDAA